MKTNTLPAILLGLGLGFTGQTQAAGCSPMVEDLFTYVKTANAGGTPVIGITMATSVNTRKFVSYTTGQLRFVPAISAGGTLLPEHLQGTPPTLFSDRSWSLPDPGCTGVACLPLFGPFDPKRPDNFGIGVYQNLVNPTIAKVILGANIVFTVHCTLGHMYGFRGNLLNSQMIDLTFTKEVVPF